MARRFLFAHEDFKSAGWSDELRQLGAEGMSLGDGYGRRLRCLLPGFWRRRCADVYVFRYLNDWPSLPRSIALLGRDAFTLFVCWVTGVRVLWIMHNVDRETRAWHPGISRLRRAMVARFARRVLVADPWLQEAALARGIPRERLGWICFGAPQWPGVDARNEALARQIRDFRTRLTQRARRVVLGLAVSDDARKKTHYLNAPDTVGALEDGTVVAMLLIGRYPQGEEFERARTRAHENEYLQVLDETIAVNERFLAPLFDFFYRSMNDLSVPFTAYVASSLEKPLITRAQGALGRIVEREQLGGVLREQDPVPPQIVAIVDQFRADGCQRFLDRRSWKRGAQVLVDAAYSDGEPE